ncbi:hypothetical protein GOY12_01615 [Wolbachia endosymbiont of Dirofilaria (Dirofilaria) immitis]|nr:hypothetical protein GOY12_01615 [Wolbachia endosymbiont of Dirofilaria (Dirofilaria) immitis]
MISLFYKLRLLSYILSNLKDITAKLFFFIIYLYISSIVLMFLSSGFWYTVKCGSFKSAFYYLLQYYKWYSRNRGNLSYGIYFRMLVAFLAPHFFYKLFLNIGRKLFLKKKVKQILRFVIEGKRSSKVNDSVYSSKSHCSYNDEDHVQEKQKVAMIRQLLVEDIEKTIDKRLNDIFFSERGKSH